MLITGVIDDIFFDDEVVKFKLESTELDSVKLPFSLFNVVKLDARYKIEIKELPAIERTREIE